MKRATLLVTALVAFMGIISCGPRGNKPNVELIQDMMESPALKAQEADDFSADGGSVRTPPEHTAPVGFTPYKWGTDLVAAERENKNPIAGEMDPENFMKGQRMFETHCAICHGSKGEGGENLSVGQKMALKPPPLVSEKVKGFTDAHIYHIITMGQGVMLPYATHVPQKYRWQLVNYVRNLQKEAK